jgi:hypothetical protein
MAEQSQQFNNFKSIFMHLPEIVKKLLQAQTEFDSAEYANCFADTAVVFDEEKTHTGKEAIKQWNEFTNNEYHTLLEPIEFKKDGYNVVLTARVSGTFSGSPILLDHHFGIENELIVSLEITLH